MSYNIEWYLNSWAKSSKFWATVHVWLIGILWKILDENSWFDTTEVFDRNRKFIEKLVSPDNDNVNLRVIANWSDWLEEVIIENIWKYNRETNNVDFCKSTVDVDTDYRWSYFWSNNDTWWVEYFKLYIKRTFERKDRSIVELKYIITIESNRFRILELETSGLEVSRKYLDTY